MSTSGCIVLCPLFSSSLYGTGAALILTATQVEERQLLKDLEDQILDVILVLDSTNDTILALLKNYRRFRQDSCVWEKQNNEYCSDIVDYAFQEKLRDVSSSIKKVRSLHAKLKSTIELVS